MAETELDTKAEPDPVAETPQQTDTADVKGEDEAKQEKNEVRRIVLHHGEQSVEVEGPDDLQTLAELAAYFWLLTTPPRTAQLGFTAGSTLITERSDPLPEEGDQC